MSTALQISRFENKLIDLLQKEVMDGVMKNINYNTLFLSNENFQKTRAKEIQIADVKVTIVNKTLLSTTIESKEESCMDFENKNYLFDIDKIRDSDWCFRETCGLKIMTYVTEHREDFFKNALKEGFIKEIEIKF